MCSFVAVVNPMKEDNSIWTQFNRKAEFKV